jgi:hypothetical protein
VIGTNALDVLGDAFVLAAALDEPGAALVLPTALVADVVACVAPAPADELAVLQPASRPIPTAVAAVSTSFTPAVACLPPFIGRPHCPLSQPLAQAAGVP